VLDNLSAHKTKAVGDSWRQPESSFHFAPTYSSWLNQVELWFAKIQRDVIARGVFTSLAGLARKLRKYVRAYAKWAKKVLGWLIPTPGFESVLTKAPGQLEVATSVGKS
jgi:hypothetical protein